MRLIQGITTRSAIVIAASALVVLGSVAAGGLVTLAAASAPNGLKGEQLAWTVTRPGTTKHCRGASGSFSFEASGRAAGPYPGTFTASGAATVTKNAPSSFSAVVKISSGKDRIRMTESLTKSGQGYGLCYPGFGEASLTAHFRAAITVTGHTWRDTGTAAVVATGGPKHRVSFSQRTETATAPKGG